MNSELIEVFNKIYTEYRYYKDELAKKYTQHHLSEASRCYKEGRRDGCGNSWRHLANYARPDKFNRVPKLLIEDSIVKMLNDIYVKMQHEEKEAKLSYIHEESTMYTEGAESLKSMWMTIAISTGLSYISPEWIPDE